MAYILDHNHNWSGKWFHFAQRKGHVHTVHILCGQCMMVQCHLLVERAIYRADIWGDKGNKAFLLINHVRYIFFTIFTCIFYLLLSNEPFKVALLQVCIHWVTELVYTDSTCVTQFCPTIHTPENAHTLLTLKREIQCNPFSIMVCTLGSCTCRNCRNSKSVPHFCTCIAIKSASDQ